MRDEDRMQISLDVRIDPMNLDVECLSQSQKFMKWAEAAVDARVEAERLELVLEVTAAKLQARMRANPEKFGLAKATEGEVKAAVACHPRRVAAAEAFLAAKASQHYLEKAVAAMETRKRMLDDLITLHGQEYFSDPSGTKKGSLTSRYRRSQAVEERVRTRQLAGLRQLGGKKKAKKKEGRSK